MKKRILHAFFLVAALGGILHGCNEIETPEGTLEDLSPYAKEFLGMMGTKAMGPNAAGLPGNRTIGMALRGALDSYTSITGSTDPGYPGDSTIIDPWPGGWQTCAVITETNHPDGSTTIVTDYGTGCEEGFGEWKYLMFGKNTNTFRHTSAQTGSVFSFEFFNRYVADGFGSTSWWDMDNDGKPDTTTWVSDGSSTFSGMSSYDTATQAFSGNYLYADTSTYTFQGVTYSTRSDGETVYTNLKSTVLRNDYEYRTGSDFYSAKVLIPLVSDYTCWMGMVAGAGMMSRPFWMIYVSGRERVTYSQQGQSGQFEIDYGDGTCDNIITIFENGKVIRIDVSTQIGPMAKGG
jgi:hypothetical protein